MTTKAKNIRVLTPEVGPLPYLLGYQKRIVTEVARFTWNNWSRQTGKSTALALRRILRGIKRGRNQLILSAGVRQSREVMEKVKQHLKAMKIAFENMESVAYDPEDRAEYKVLECKLPEALGGIRILGLPANPDTARGFTGDVFLDEFAMHKRDREIFGAMFPSVMRHEGELDVASTPKGRGNMFYRLSDNPEYAHSTVTIHDAIAEGLEADAEQLRRAINDDELWRQEFLCEFLDEATAFLTHEMIAECEDAKLPRELDVAALLERKEGEVYGGFDIGRKKDLSVLWCFEKVGQKLASLGMIEMASTRFREQCETVSHVVGARAFRRLCVDSTGLGMQLAEDLITRWGSRVEACTFTQAFKEAAGGQLRVRFDDRTIAIPADPQIRNDLHSVRRTVTAAGNVRLEAPREDGSHADRFWAAALAWHAASDTSGPFECVMGPKLPLNRGSW